MVQGELLPMGVASIAAALPFGAGWAVARMFPRPRHDVSLGAAMLVMMILTLTAQIAIWSCSACDVRGGCSTTSVGLFTFPCVALPAGTLAYVLVDQFIRDRDASAKTGS